MGIEKVQCPDYLIVGADDYIRPRADEVIGPYTKRSFVILNAMQWSEESVISHGGEGGSFADAQDDIQTQFVILNAMQWSEESVVSHGRESGSFAGAQDDTFAMCPYAVSF